ncbi:hypothetical protein [Emcibacter nanhaiensis]|uniref:hypothetical protein n=1 Tax=Emcibacter nanhaiensis TaxID=1505037 RepID=UPI0015E364E7|nr:hypothetical protein [Emcibacter nanhaiensis]
MRVTLGIAPVLTAGSLIAASAVREALIQGQAAMRPFVKLCVAAEIPKAGGKIDTLAASTPKKAGEDQGCDAVFFIRNKDNLLPNKEACIAFENWKCRNGLGDVY